MKILMTGATGLIGSELVSKLCALGHELTVISRKKNKIPDKFSAQLNFIEHDLNKAALAAELFNDIEVIIHLAGETIDGYWTKAKKEKVLQSRANTSQNLLQNCPRSVKTIITASAVGYYGDRGDELLTERSSCGQSFLSNVCIEWEKEFQRRLTLNDQRIVILRIGMVLSSQGGALKKLISIFKKNLGAVLGDGQQWVSYISLRDLVSIVIKSVEDENFKGVINATNDHPVTNKEMTRLLAQNLHVMTLPAAPKFVLKVALGEMSDLVLHSTRVKPQRLLDLKYQFIDSDFESILKKEISLS